MGAGRGTGFFGKLPALGDFVQRGLPGEFVTPWDAWLERAIAASRAGLGEQWLDIYLTSPLWRFVLGAGPCGTRAWAGVMMPSVDRVGRYFPLTVATPLAAGCDPFALLQVHDAWFGAVEALLLGALDAEQLDPDDFAAELAALPAPVGDAALVRAARLYDGWRVDLAGGYDAAAVAGAIAGDALAELSLWCNAGAEGTPAVVLAYAGLPAADAYTGLLCGGEAAPAPFAGLASE